MEKLLTLPDVISAYFALPKQATPQELKSVFAEDAHIIDEAEGHTGFPAITEWWRDVNERTPFEAVPERLQERDGKLVVTADVSGAFPGSPVKLDHHFRVRDGKVVELEIK